jgi:hypothetical protein
MFQVIDLCVDSDSDDNGEWPNTAFVPLLPLSRKRPFDKEESSNDGQLDKKNGSRKKTATGLAEYVEFGADEEFANKVELSPPNKKRRSVMKSERSVKNEAAGKCAQIVSEDSHVAGHREYHQGITAAISASRAINSDSEQASRDTGSVDEYSQKLSTSTAPSNASGRRQWKVSAWGDRLSELADFRKSHGHCRVPQRCSEYTKLANWVTYQRRQYKEHLEGKKSKMTVFRIQELESLGFGWGVCATAWEDRLSELTDYSIIHGHCNVPKNYHENTQLAYWVGTQRREYRLHQEGKKSHMTTSRIRAPPGKTI